MGEVTDSTAGRLAVRIGLSLVPPWVWVLLALLGLILILGPAALIGAFAGSQESSDVVLVYGWSALALRDIPGNYLTLYEGAAKRYGLQPHYIAAIGKIETDHGRSAAPGVRSGVNFAGCCAGPMQFYIKGSGGGTWGYYGVDGDIDGNKDVYNATDAIYGAGNYLKASGAPENWDQAIFAYNHADWYVDDVKSLAVLYRGDLKGGSGNNTSSKKTASELVNGGQIDLSSGARADLLSGLVDERLVRVLGAAANKWRFSISVIRTGHSKFTTGGSISNHWVWRGADIWAVDGKSCTTTPIRCERLARFFLNIEGLDGPTEIGWKIDIDGSGPIGFGDPQGHSDHVHLGYDS